MHLPTCQQALADVTEQLDTLSLVLASVSSSVGLCSLGKGSSGQYVQPQPSRVANQLPRLFAPHIWEERPGWCP